jgi:DNA modification methylase
LGKNPSDYWEIVLRDWENEVWNVPNVKSNHVEKTEHPCQYPVELVERCVLALTDVGDWVLDPFGGVGSTLLASLMCDRNAVAIEKEEKYIDIGRERIRKFELGELITRPVNKPIYDHTRSPLSRVPEELVLAAK